MGKNEINLNLIRGFLLYRGGYFKHKKKYDYYRLIISKKEGYEKRINIIKKMFDYLQKRFDIKYDLYKQKTNYAVYVRRRENLAKFKEAIDIENVGYRRKKIKK